MRSLQVSEPLLPSLKVYMHQPEAEYPGTEAGVDPRHHTHIGRRIPYRWSWINIYMNGFVQSGYHSWHQLLQDKRHQY